MTVKRNFEGVQFQTLREGLDGAFNALHDELTHCYEQGEAFQTYGVLSKEQFDKLHALIWHMYNLAFHAANMAQAPGDRIPEEDYNYLDLDKTVKKTDVSNARITTLNGEGFTLTIE